jgi:maltose O-acetyltransferase
MKKLLKVFLRKTRIGRLFLKFFAFVINETMHQNPSILYFAEKISKERKAKEKSLIIENIKRFGTNSFFWGDIGKITCPENLEIGENVHIGNNSYIRAEGGVCIGDNTHISRNLVLYSINHNYQGVNLPYDNSFDNKPVKIGKNVWIGMNVCITPGTIIGDGAIIGMGTTVSGEVPRLTIIGSQKWRELRKRDKDHYNALDNLGRYGAINGQLYVNRNVMLYEIGDRKNSKRSILEVIDYNGEKAVKKLFLDTKDGKQSFNYEKLAIEKFQDYKWFPKVHEVKEMYIIYEYFDNEQRLDRSLKRYNTNMRTKVLKQIISVLIDIFSQNVAHRDFHSKNIFLTKNQEVKVIDFETIAVNIDNNSDFFNSYDVIGKGLESPYLTKNMCVFNSSEFSISKLFSVKDINEFKKLSESLLIDKLFETTSTFFTRRYLDNKRHSLKDHYIYTTFNLPYLKVNSKIGQRNIKKRLKKFGIVESLISGKKVLDIGSNTGGVLFELKKMNPKKAVGIEYDLEKVKLSNSIAKIHAFKNIEFLQIDVESMQFLKDFNEKYDIVFCLAVVEHLKNKEVFINKLAQICSGILFLEGNSVTNVNETINALKQAGFINIEYLGLSDDEKNNKNNNRPMFICSI